jgi:hypothetical protein
VGKVHRRRDSEGRRPKRGPCRLKIKTKKIRLPYHLLFPCPVVQIRLFPRNNIVAVSLGINPPPRGGLRQQASRAREAFTALRNISASTGKIGVSLSVCSQRIKWCYRCTRATTDGLAIQLSDFTPPLSHCFPLLWPLNPCELARGNPFTALATGRIPLFLD